MTFTELCAEVYILTRRPDLVAVTESAVKSATLLAHHSDFYYKDMVELGIAFASSIREQQLDYRAVAPRYRALKYLRKYDYVNQTPGAMLSILLPEQLFDRYMITKEDVCYVAGASINIKSSTAEQYYLFGYYTSPNIVSASYDSWIADDYPYAIIYPAAGTVFKTIGKDEEASAFNNLALQHTMTLQRSNVSAEGF